MMSRKIKNYACFFALFAIGCPQKKGDGTNQALDKNNEMSQHSDNSHSTTRQSDNNVNTSNHRKFNVVFMPISYERYDPDSGYDKKGSYFYQQFKQAEFLAAAFKDDLKTKQLPINVITLDDATKIPEGTILVVHIIPHATGRPSLFEQKKCDIGVQFTVFCTEYITEIGTPCVPGNKYEDLSLKIEHPFVVKTFEYLRNKTHECMPQT